MARDRDEGGGKRTKSWREIDAQRGKSKYHSRQDDPAQQKLEKSPSYQNYKKEVDALFGANVPVAEGVAAEDASKKAQKEALLKIAEAPDRKVWAERVADFVEKYKALPEDPYLLDSVLDHPKDRLVDKALSALEKLFDEGRLPREKRPKSLEQRLRTLEMTALDSEVQQRAKTLRLKL
jgi:hypothetical protein